MPRFQQSTADGYESLTEQLKSLGDANPDEDVFIFFIGSNEAESGQNWCPDCRKALPKVQEAVAHLEAVWAQSQGEPQGKQKTVFITCLVGPKTSWKDSNNSFRQDALFQLTCIPTLLHLKRAADSPLGGKASDHLGIGLRLVKDEEFADIETIKQFLSG